MLLRNKIFIEKYIQFVYNIFVPKTQENIIQKSSRELYWL